LLLRFPDLLWPEVARAFTLFLAAAERLEEALRCEV